MPFFARFKSSLEKVSLRYADFYVCRHLLVWLAEETNVTDFRACHLINIDGFVAPRYDGDILKREEYSLQGRAEVRDGLLRLAEGVDESDTDYLATLPNSQKCYFGR